MNGTMSVNVLAAACLALLVVSPIASADPESAKVTKSPSHPVPISGSVTVSGTANVNVTNIVPISGSVNATVTNVPGVTVNNSPDNPVQVRNVDNAAFQPFQSMVVVPMNTSVPLVTVPAGQRLVVEFFSSEVFGPMPTRYFVSAVDAADPGRGFFTHFIAPPPPQGIATAQAVRMYVEPGQALAVDAAGNGSGNCCFISITGYFVNIAP
jgi:hypothetical protein